MKPMTEQELRAAAGDELVDAMKNHIVQLKAQNMDAEQIKAELATKFDLDSLGSVGRLVPIGLADGPDAQ